MIAALYVETNGVYFGLPNVDPWDVERDARKYAGPYPVVAHPPCERWGRYWYGGPTLHRLGRRKQRGDDGGCFAAALDAVRTWGGVLEHPADSSAWDHFGLVTPPREGGWVAADWSGGWTCCVEQGHYGHRARKATWLYACGVLPPALRWGPSSAASRLEESFRSSEERRQRRAAGVKPIRRISDTERAATPIPFRDLLISIAESARGSVQKVVQSPETETATTVK